MKNIYWILTVALIMIIFISIFVYTQFEQPSSNGPSNTPTDQPQITLNGAGASFPYPLLNSMIFEYTQSIAKNVQINYQPVGSGGGISALIEKTVDFAGSDAPLRPTESDQAPNTLHIPETIGAVTIAYRLPGISSGLNLSGKVIADIFLGRIIMWNDPAIQSINPDLILPNHGILAVHRSDGSGTTFIFTGYLSAVSSSWERDVGQGKMVEWPAGTGSSGNAGVSSVILGQEYTIGYVELAYALENDMALAAIQNPAGNFILPSLESSSHAAESVASSLPSGDGDWSKVNILNAPGDQSYPIVSFSYLIVYKELNVIPGMTIEKASALTQFFSYVIHNGQELSPPLEYAPIPQGVVHLNENTLNSMTFDGERLL